MPRKQRTTEELIEAEERSIERSKQRLAALKARAKRERREAMERSCSTLARSVAEAMGRPLTDSEIETATVAAVDALRDNANDGGAEE